jgi:hypothetical protein
MAKTSQEATMQARYSPLQMAMTCHGMTRGLRSAISDLAVPAPWEDTSTAWKSAAIGEVERVLRHPIPDPSPPDLSPDRLVEASLFMLIVGRMAAELR